jgi:hypothetical protein
MSRPTLVVDASVAIKWVLPEEGHGLALRIQDLYEDEKLDLVAPCLLIAEAGNVLWKRVRRGELTREAAERCFLPRRGACPPGFRLSVPGLGAGAALRPGDG